MSHNPHQPHIEEKSINDAPGFECKVCGRGRIKLSLAQFLDSSSCCCPLCGTSYEMDKTQCASLIGQLQELRIATENVKFLKGEDP